MIYSILATNLSRMVSSASIGFMPAIEPLSMCALSSAENQQNWTVCQEDWVFKTSHWIPGCPILPQGHQQKQFHGI